MTEKEITVIFQRINMLKIDNRQTF